MGTIGEVYELIEDIYALFNDIFIISFSDAIILTGDILDHENSHGR